MSGHQQLLLALGIQDSLCRVDLYVNDADTFLFAFFSEVFSFSHPVEDRLVICGAGVSCFPPPCGSCKVAFIKSRLFSGCFKSIRGFLAPVSVDRT